MKGPCSACKNVKTCVSPCEKLLKFLPKEDSIRREDPQKKRRRSEEEDKIRVLDKSRRIDVWADRRGGTEELVNGPDEPDSEDALRDEKIGPDLDWDIGDFAGTARQGVLLDSSEIKRLG